MFQVTAAANPGQADEVAEMVRTLLHELGANGAREEELQRAKEQVVSGLLMGLESSLGRMNRAAKLVLYDLPLWSAEQFVEQIEKISLAEVNQTAALLFGRPLSCLMLGPKKRKRKQ